MAASATFPNGKMGNAIFPNGKMAPPLIPPAAPIRTVLTWCCLIADSLPTGVVFLAWLEPTVLIWNERAKMNMRCRLKQVNCARCKLTQDFFGKMNK